MLPRIALLFVLLAAPSQAVEIVRVWPAYREASYFDSIAESFSGVERTSGEVILRTQPQERAGFYFFVRLARPEGAARLRLDAVPRGARETRTWDWALPSPVGSSLLVQAGLTGADWPAPGGEPVAWRIQILDASGSVLAERCSFLWAKP